MESNVFKLVPPSMYKLSVNHLDELRQGHLIQANYAIWRISYKSRYVLPLNPGYSQAFDTIHQFWLNLQLQHELLVFILARYP